MCVGIGVAVSRMSEEGAGAEPPQATNNGKAMNINRLAQDQRRIVDNTLEPPCGTG